VEQEHEILFLFHSCSNKLNGKLTTIATGEKSTHIVTASQTFTQTTLTWQLLKLSFSFQAF